MSPRPRPRPDPRPQPSPRPESLGAALDALAGRGPRETSDPSMLAYAARLLSAARRVDELPPCPPAVLRRVEGLFASRTESVASRVLSILFDSWAAGQPAMRGARSPRLVRCGIEGASPGVTLDLEVTPVARGVSLRVALAGPETYAVGVVTPGFARTRAVALDARGRGSIRLDAKATEAVVLLKRGRREVFRSPAISLR